MSQLQGAWASGENDAFADPEEKRVLYATLDSFRYVTGPDYTNLLLYFSSF